MQISNIESRIEDHRNSFQRIDIEELRRRREDYAVELRRQKRSQHNLKRRAVNSGYTPLLEMEGEEVIIIQGLTPELIEAIPNLGSSSYSDTQKLLFLRDNLLPSTSSSIVLDILKVLRETLSTEKGAPIGTFINLGLGPILLRYLDLGYSPEIVEQASWTVCNLLSGAHEYVENMVSIGMIPALIKIIHPDAPNCIEHSLWGLANLAGDCQEFRNEILKEGILGLMSELLKSSGTQIVLLRVIAWLMCNLCRGIMNYSMEIVEQMVFIIKKITILTHDPSCISECLWGANYVGQGDNNHIECIIRANFVTLAFKYLTPETPDTLLTPALRTAGCVATGSNDQTQLVINLGILDRLLPLIKSSANEIRKEVYWILSNIAVGTPRQITTLISHPIMSEALKGLLETDQNIFTEVGWFFSNLSKKSHLDQILVLDELSILNYLKEGYRKQNAEFIKHMLELTVALLSAGRQLSDSKGVIANEMAVKFRDTGCLDVLENLQAFPNDEIHTIVIRILDEFWGTDEVFAEQQLDVPANGFDFS